MKADQCSSWVKVDVWQLCMKLDFFFKKRRFVWSGKNLEYRLSMYIVLVWVAEFGRYWPERLILGWTVALIVHSCFQVLCAVSCSEFIRRLHLSFEKLKTCPLHHFMTTQQMIIYLTILFNIFTHISYPPFDSLWLACDAVGPFDPDSINLNKTQQTLYHYRLSRWSHADRDPIN